MVERIRFKVEGGGKQLGFLVGDWLVCSLDGNGKFKIYRRDTGKPLMSASWDDINEAIRFAEWLDSIYSEYFPIWEVEPLCDIFKITQWTIKNGIEAATLLDMLKDVGKKRSITQRIVDGLFETVGLKRDVPA